jgi:AraC-like DNA-binding protein
MPPSKKPILNLREDPVTDLYGNEPGWYGGAKRADFVRFVALRPRPGLPTVFLCGTMALPQREDSLLRLSTEDLPVSERFPFWREVFGRSILRLEFERVNAAPFSASAVLYGFEDLGIALGQTNGLRARRTRELTGDGSDDLICHINLFGASVVSQLGREAHVSTGAASLLSAAEPGEHTCNGPTRILNLRFPRRVLRSHCDPEAALARCVSAENESLKLLVDYISAVAGRHEFAAPQAQRAFIAHVHDLLRLSFGTGEARKELAASQSLRIARLEAIKQDIEAGLPDESLSVVNVASRRRLSARYVQLLFEEQGTTFSEYLIERRLASAYRLLTALPSEARTIAAIAYEAGFSNLSYFNRTFRRRYGATPSEIRKASRREPG